MQEQALTDVLVADLAGTIASGYCAKLFADYGARVVNLEPEGGFATRRLPPFLAGKPSDEASAMHAFLHTNKESAALPELAPDKVREIIARADLVLTDEASEALAGDCPGVACQISWFGAGGPYAHFTGSDAQCFAMNGMLRNIGRIEGPPLIPTGYQAQIIGGVTAFIGGLVQVLAGELGNRKARVELDVSIFEACLCFTEVGIVGSHNTGIEASRMGVNRYPPTYPLGVFPCRDGWLGVTVLTPSQWRSFCEMLDMMEFAEVELFQSSVGRLQAIDVIEPVMREKLLEHAAEDLFQRSQSAAIPLARVPTMEELFGIDQFLARNAFSKAALPDGTTLAVPSVPFRLFDTPPNFGGAVARLGEHTQAWSEATS